MAVGQPDGPRRKVDHERDDAGNQKDQHAQAVKHHDRRVEHAGVRLTTASGWSTVPQEADSIASATVNPRAMRRLILGLNQR